jgi:hypothetical protein
MNHAKVSNKKKKLTFTIFMNLHKGLTTSKFLIYLYFNLNQINQI